MGAVILLAGTIVFGVWFAHYIKTHPRHHHS